MIFLARVYMPQIMSSPDFLLFYIHLMLLKEYIIAVVFIFGISSCAYDWPVKMRVFTAQYLFKGSGIGLFSGLAEH